MRSSLPAAASVRRGLAAVLTLALLAAGCSSKTARSASASDPSSTRSAPASQPTSRATSKSASQASSLAPSRPPRPDHVVVVVLENHSYSEVLDGSQAPFIASLATDGAVFTQSFAVTHPSEPNY